MPLFEGNAMRSTLYAGGAAVVAHLVMMLVPSSVQTYSLMQTAVAILAIASLAVMVLTHHRRSGSFLSQTQEEMVLIAAFGLLWFEVGRIAAVLLGWRAFQQRGINPGEAANTDLASATGRTSNRYSEGFTPGKRPYPCRSDSVYCVVEEWTYW
ncbi:hypothetical protein GSI_00878 [Ganoderma sinense ZZ0214-1]|uniref:Uncharacterized protein n=1 Tax=Ganoderma sinense ZZ0214-1 TaxID=1077348 RepID=A0A2G8STT0_9APHY|nr:hypothetical protein GSI_00878 [Ganoderma sinense ZZ0214-1]